VGRSFAWDVDYEWANMGSSRMGYPDYDDWNYGGYSSFQGTKDKAMNQLTKNTLRAQHTLQAGVEYRPVSAFAIRLGYNFITLPFKKNPTFDQYSLDSRAMDFSTSTCFMTTGPTNIVTFGLGYSYKHFYADLAYKVRNIDAEFYPFDCYYAQAASGSQFVQDNPQLAGHTISPRKVDLTRQAITCTLGFKF
jgi:opacity protein-like surface antigen